MKKSIFLFFAAILCAMSANAKVVYLKLNDKWSASEARYYVHVWGGSSSNTSIEMQAVEGETNMYKIEVGTHNSIIFLRHKTTTGVTDSNKWNNLLNRLGNLSIPEDKNCCTINNGVTTVENGNDNGAASSVTWSTYTPAEPEPEPEPVETHDITVKAKYPATWTAGKAAIHFWGTGVASPGTPAAMTKDGDWWTYTVTGVPTTTELSVIFINGNTWNGDANQTVDITGITESTCYQVTAGSGKALAAKADCETGEGEVIETHDITVKAFYPAAWNAGKAAVHFWGDGVASPGTPAAMTKDGDWWSYTVTGVPTTTELSVIFINGNTWNGDANQTVDITGIKESTCYQITSGSGKASAAVVDCASTPVVAEDVYTVVGSDNLFGSAWSPAAEANDMEKQDDGSYKKVYSNVELTSDVIWKIAKNDDWWNGPTFNANNNTLSIAKSGIYNVTFTLSADLKTANATAELLEETNKVADCYISGNAALTGGAGWAGNEFKMEYNEATATYSYTFTALAAETEYLLKVVLGDWYGYEKLQTVPAGVENKEGNIAFTLAEAGDVTVTYNKDNGINITGNFAIPVTYDYYIAGTLAGGWNAKQQGMESIDGVYKHTFTELAAGTYQFKVTNGKWGNEEGGFECIVLGAEYEEVSIVEGNVQIVTEEAINLTVIFDGSKITFDGLTEKVPAEKHYYLRGSFNEWADVTAEYELTLEGEVYKKEVTFAQDVEFKVNDGADAWLGFADLGGKTYAEVIAGNDGNIKMKEEKTFTVIFDAANNLITFEGLTVVEDYYTIVGATAITGVNWDPANEDNKMTKDGEAYTLTKTGLQLEAGDYEYKVAKNGAWNNGDYPAEGNQIVTIDENGVYTIVYTYTVGTSLEAVATKTGEYAPAQAVYTVAGDAALCGNNWQADDATNDMTANGDGTFTWTKTGVEITGTVGFKVVKNHDFGNGAYPNDNWNIVPENYEGNAIYTVTITFTESSKDIAVTLTKTGETTPVVVTYQLKGVGGWDQPGIELVQNPGNDKEYMLTCQAISATDAIKVVRLEDGVIKDYYGNGTVKDGVEVTVNYDGDGNITLPEGKYNFYFDTNEPDKKLWIAAATGCGTEPTPDYTRAVTPGNFGTICLPNGGTMVGASIFEIAYKDDSKIYFDEILSNEMVAGIPYIFLPIGGVDQIEVYYTDEANAAANTVNGLVGSYTQELLVADGNNYILLNNQYCEVIGEAYVGANRAYFQLNGIRTSAPAPAPGARRVSMGMAGQNTATGMENVDASAQPVKTIINGQLFILRGEKMYDAQGKLVK